jgi:hypothetical protein
MGDKMQTVKKWQGIPDCSEPDEFLYAPDVNSMLRCIKRERKQRLDPDGYREEMRQASERARQKQVKGSKEGGKKE